MYVHNLLISVWICAGVLGLNAATFSESPAPPTTPFESQVSSTALSEAPASSAVTPEGPATFSVTPEGPATSAVTPEGPATSAVTPEGPATSAVTPEGPATSAVTPEGPATSAVTAEGPATSAVTPEGPATSAVTPEGPATSAVTPEGPATSAVTPEGPATSAVTPEGPATSAVTSEGPATSAVTSEGPATSGVTSEGPATSAVPSEGPTTPSPGHCSPNPCGFRVQCEERFNNFTCVCIGGLTYNEGQKSCDDAKVFPGYIIFLDLEHDVNMSNTISQVFQETATAITEAMKTCFSAPEGYIESRVLKLNPAPTTSTLGSPRKTSVNATVENFFQTFSTVTMKTVEESIDKGLQESINPKLKGGKFAGGNLCIVNPPCNALSTECSFSEGNFTCSCNDGYIESGLSSRICTACPSGEQASGGKCVDCPFGYSGFNCNESWKLTLVIVGTVLGGLLLVMLIVVPIVARKPSKKSSSKSAEKDFESPYVSHSTAKAPVPNGNSAKFQATAMAYASAGVPKIPRATSNNSGWDRGSNLEMTESNSRQSLVAKGYNGLRTYEEPDLVTNFNNRSPYDNSLSRNQGQTNPYYTHDNGRRFN